MKSKNKARAVSITFKSYIAPSLLLPLRLRYGRSKRKEGIRADKFKDRNIVTV